MSNVRDFGAKGDGKADDTTAIQHAIDQGDGVVEFFRGDYRITRPLQVNLKQGRIALRGAGGTTKLIMAGSGPAISIIGTHAKSADPQGFAPGIWQQERMPTVSDLEITGDHPEADGIRVEGAMQPTFTGLLLRKLRHGIHVTNRGRNILVSHCHIYENTGIGIYFDRLNLHQAIITGSHISYNRLGGVRIENSEIRNLQITGNDIEYNNNRAIKVPGADAEPTAEIYIDAGEKGTIREGTISSNTIQATYSPNGANIRFIGGPGGENQRVGMWTITGNLIGSQAINVHLTSVRGVTFTGNYVYSGHVRNLVVESSRNIVIGDNCFGHNPDYGDKELCTGIRLVDCESCTLTGGVIEDALAGQNTVKDAVPVERQGLVELIRCRLVTVSGMQILEGEPVAVYLEDCDETAFHGCTILDRREPAKTGHSILWKGRVAHGQISHCRLAQPVEAPESVKRLDCY